MGIGNWLGSFRFIHSTAGVRTGRVTASSSAAATATKVRTRVGTAAAQSSVTATVAQTPTLLFDEPFDTRSIGSGGRWLPGFWWQNPVRGSIGLGGLRSWMGNPFEVFGGSGAALYDQAPTSAAWHAWYGAEPTFSTSPLAMSVTDTAELTGAAVAIPASTAVTLTVTASAGANVQPFLRAHNNGSSYITPAETLPGDPQAANGVLAVKSLAGGSQTWTATFAGARSHVDLRLIVTGGSAVITNVAVASGTPSGGQTLDPFTVRDGELVIEATPMPEWAVPYVRASMDAQGQQTLPTPAWVGGIVESTQSFTRPCYVEVEAQFDPFAGMFPAIWLLSRTGADTPKGGAENDILEVFGDASGRPVHITTHYRDGSPNGGVDVRPQVTASISTVDTSGWHRYGLEWTETALRYYVDDALVREVTGVDAAWFDVPMVIRLDLEVGAFWFTAGNQPGGGTP